MEFNKEPTKISMPLRIIYFIVGMAIATTLVVYGISWNTTAFEFSIFNVSINQWFIAVFVVISGLVAGSMIKTAITGYSKID